jgi:hypothetical protein
VAAESEHCESDEGLWAVKAERDPGEQPDFGVGRFDESLGETMVEVGVDRFAMFRNPLGKVDEGGEL